ncbi:MAG TPA: hypothetical protein VM221_05620 [Armatimonadota bacterium]|nr:hypothetical protein [Armatimonadota bacterium]
MRWWALFSMFALVLLIPQRSLGDGMVIAPSSVLGYLSEQTQIAVVEVKSDFTVGVHLFISLLESSGQSRQVHFLLPLQTMPREFTVREQTLEAFSNQHVKPLDRIYEAARAEQSRMRMDTVRGYALGSLLAGPYSMAVGAVAVWETRSWQAVSPADAPAARRGVSVPVPELSVETKHSRTDVYRALKREELAALASLPSLPEAVGNALAGYEGRPFALVRLRTVPAPPSAARDRAGPGRRLPGAAAKQPGLHFHFTQEMQAQGGVHLYEYPLGTGQGWEHAIQLTQVYVVAPEALALTVRFPDRGRGQGWLPDSEAAGNALAFAARGRQVHMAEYWDSNPRQDVRISVRSGAGSEFTRAHGKEALLMAAVWIGFPAFGLLIWLGGVRAAIWTGERKQQRRFAATAWRSWWVAQALWLPAVGAAAWLLRGAGDFWELSWPGADSLVLGLWFASGLGVMHVVLMLVPRPARDFAQRAGLAAAVTGLIYVAASSLVLSSFIW